MKEKFYMNAILAKKNELLQIISNMSSLLDDYQREMSNISDSSTIYSSDNASNIKEHFTSNYNKFKEFMKTLEEVVLYLEKASSAYDTLNKEILKKIESFPDIVGGKYL